MWSSKGGACSFHAAIGFALACVLMALAGCARPAQKASANPVSLSMNERMNIKVVISEFKQGAIRDDFSDGSHMSYDLTILTIREQGPYHGVRVQVVHGTNPPSGSPWTAVGHECVLEVDPWLLSDPEMLVPREELHLEC
jgi:hypothetical protein